MTLTAQAKKNLELASNTIRVLAAEVVDKAKSGHPGMPMGMAELAASLWLRHLRFMPENPKWPGRDRFVLSNGHGSALLYTMLHLSGYALSMNDLKQFRQWESLTPGHPESHLTPGVETTTGPLGQGIANAVGMAIAQKMMAARYGQNGFNPVDHRVFCFAGDGCMMEGISGEASSIAGHLGLGNLTVIYDDNKISIAGKTSLAFSEDVGARYEAYGWKVQYIDGHDLEQIDQALTQACSETTAPSLIVARTTIGKGSPSMADTSEVHGSPLGVEELKRVKQALNWPEEDFYVPEQVRGLFAARVEELKSTYEGWQKQYKQWAQANSELEARFGAQLALEVPADLEDKLIAALPTDNKPVATRKLSSIVLQAAAANVPALAGGSADLEPSTLTLIKDSTDITRDSFSGRNLRFGVREHAMGAIMNGLAYYGGWVPYGSTFFVFLDYMRETVRLAALSHLPSLFIYTHDSIFVGEDGPTHEPVEHLQIMRLTPNLYNFRPADGLETAVCYAAALERKDGPSSLVLTRQNLEPFKRPAGFRNGDIRKGAYAAVEPENGKEPELVFIATGSEVPLAIETAKLLGKPYVRVVSMPCYELFAAQSESYRSALIPKKAKKVVVEAGSTFGWLGMVDGSSEDTLLIGIDHFGASAPFKVLAEKFGLTAASIAERTKAKFSL